MPLVRSCSALAANDIIVILIDQNVVAREAVFVPFFGRLAATLPRSHSSS